MSKGKWYRGEKPWERFGLTRDQYRYREKKGLPFVQKIPHEKTDDILKMFTERPPMSKGRYSGLNYDNPPERIAELKERYKNGVTDKMIKEWIGVS